MTSQPHHSDSTPWWSFFKAIDGITVIHIDLDPDDVEETEALAWLDQDEKERWRRFRIGQPRRQFAFCRAALRANLCGCLGCGNGHLSFGYLQHGKPFAIVGGKASAIRFNVSHSGTHGMIALGSQGQLGLDLEIRSARRDLDGAGAIAYGPNERAALAKAGGYGKVELFFKLWTIKEALIKAFGTGLSLHPAGFEIPLPMLRGANSGIVRLPDMQPNKWRLEYWGEDRFAAALAYEQPHV